MLLVQAGAQFLQSCGARQIVESTRTLAKAADRVGLWAAVPWGATAVQLTRYTFPIFTIEKRRYRDRSAFSNGPVKKVQGWPQGCVRQFDDSNFCPLPCQRHPCILMPYVVISRLRGDRDAGSGSFLGVMRASGAEHKLSAKERLNALFFAPSYSSHSPLS